MPKRNNPHDPKKFQRKLKLLASYMTIAQMTELFGIENQEWQVKNWIYRDRANLWAIRLLTPIVDTKLAEFATKTKTKKP